MPLRIIEENPEKRAEMIKSLRKRGLEVEEKSLDNIDLGSCLDVPVIEVTAGKQVPYDRIAETVSAVYMEVSSEPLVPA